MATNLSRAKLILSGALNKPLADITDAMIDKAGRAFAYRADEITGIATYDALAPADRVAYFVGRMEFLVVKSTGNLRRKHAADQAARDADAAGDPDFVPAP
jgi:hypothetical protein